MRGTGISKLMFTGVLMVAVFISGCKKESAAVKQVAPVTITGTQVDSTNYFKGTFDGEPVKFEGNAQAYSAFEDPDSAHGGNGGGEHDQDAYYMSGSKWVQFASGLVATNASIELRSLSVRVFVSPIVTTSVNFYNLLGPNIYPVADNDGIQGAYITLHDKNGVLWTSKGDQDGSSLIILTRGANMSTYTVLSGIVNAKLYDSSHNMKKLTAASFTAAVGI